MENIERPGGQSDLDRKPITIRDSYKGSGKLKNKNALITGGDSGIGRAVAVHFAREGCNVMFAYLNEDSDARETKRLVVNEGVSCTFLAGDLRTERFRERLIAEFAQKHGSLDILVNNAGTQYTEKSLEEISEEHVRETFDLNIIGMILLTKRALGLMGPGGAHHKHHIYHLLPWAQGTC